MSNLNATVQSTIEGQVVNVRWVCYLDISTDPLRATTGLYSKTFSSTGDADLDGFTFDSIPSDLVSVSEVQHDESGSNQVAVTLSGLIVNNVDLLNLIGDRTKWQGRTARLWWYVVDGNETQITSNVYGYYTGYMNDVTINGSPESQSITMTIEHYLATLTVTSNKTYAMQREFDSGDYSADASVAVANGTSAWIPNGVDETMLGVRTGGYTFGAFR